MIFHPIDVRPMDIIFEMLPKLVHILTDNEHERQSQAQSIAKKVITTLVSFISTNDTLDSSPAPQTVIQATLQCLDVMTQYSELFDLLIDTPDLERHLYALAHHPLTPSARNEPMPAHMKQTLDRLLIKLTKDKKLSYRDSIRQSLELCFADAVCTTRLPEGLNVQPVPGDGHCLYHAVGLHLPNNPSIQTLRNQVADYVLEHRSQYEASITGSFYAYVAGIRHHAWGDHIEIDALMHIYQRRIYVFQENGLPMMTPGNAGVFSGAPIPVLYNNVNHYSAMTLNTSVSSSMQHAINTEPKPLIPTLNADIITNISTFLSSHDLQAFLGARARTQRLDEPQELRPYTFFSSNNKGQKRTRDKDESDETQHEATDEPNKKHR